MLCNDEICVIIRSNLIIMTSFFTIHALCGDDLSVKIRTNNDSCEDDNNKVNFIEDLT
jgi:hypothetical protein